MKKVLKFIKNFIVGIIAAVFFAFVIAITILLLNFNDKGVTVFDDTSLIIIRKKISFEQYQKGDLVLVKSQDIKDINVGDEIFVYILNQEKRTVSIDVGIVGDVHLKDDAISFDNGSTYGMEFVIGKAEKTYNDLGKYLSIIQSKWGFLFMILVPSFLIFIYELYALIVEIKYGGKSEK